MKRPDGSWRKEDPRRVARKAKADCAAAPPGLSSRRMDSKRLLLATIGAPHGVRGEVRLKVFAADPASLRAYGPLADDSGRRFELKRLRPGKEVAIAKFRGVDDRNAAEALNGISLTVGRDRL